MLVGKFVLTGGSCGGKSSALSTMYRHLTDLGYQVYVIEESATKIIHRGIRPFGENAVDKFKFQEMVLRYQLVREKYYEDIASEIDANCIIICDRGCLDGKAFITEQQFNQLLHQLGYSMIDMLQRYDMVLHLVSAADGAETHYTLSNNEARSETPEQALQQDRLIRSIWSGHTHMHIIDNRTDFTGKLDRVIQQLDNFLGIPVTLREQRKFLVHLNPSLFQNIKKMATEIHIQSFYLKNSSCEKRIQFKTIDNETAYFYTEQVKGDYGVSRIVREKKINRQIAYSYLKDTAQYDTINKIRYVFVLDKQICRLDVYENGLCILEIDVTMEHCQLNELDMFGSIKEITGDDAYLTRNIAKGYVLRKESKFV